LYIPNPFFSLEQVAEASATDLASDMCGPSSDCFWLRRRTGRFTIYGTLATSSHCEMLFPTVSFPLLKLILGGVNDSQRAGSAFYKRCLLAHYPDYFRTIPYQRTGCGLGESRSIPARAFRRARRLATRLTGRTLRQWPQIADYDKLIGPLLVKKASLFDRALLDEHLGGQAGQWIRSFQQGQSSSTIASHLLTAELYLRMCVDGGAGLNS